MKITSVSIRNFRSLHDVTVAFDSVTTLIGPNGSGKSTVLRALDWFFNGARNGELTDADCSFGATDQDIVVQVTFGDLTDKDREALGKYAPDAATSFTAWKTRAPNGLETFSANARSYPPFALIREQLNAGDRKVAYNSLRDSDSSLGLPGWTNQEAAMQALVAWESDHPEQLEESPETQQTKFFGFNSGGKMGDLFDFVLVTGDLRASEETQDSKASVIGKILERSVDRTAADEEIAEIVENSRVAQQRVYEAKFSAQLEAMMTQLNHVVESYAPGRSIQIVPTDVELKAPKTTFDISVLDGSTETIVERQGHGFQRTLLISALQLLAESTAATTEGVICLAIEEPELFQHPTQAQAFARVLRSLADDPEKRFQVTYATHSPYFVEARHFDQIRRLTRTVADPPRVTVHSASVDDVKSKLVGVVKASVVGNQLDAFTVGQLSTALFASRVLVVEGTTEAAVFYGVGDRGKVAQLESRGTMVVPANGKSSIPLAHAILTSLGIPAYGVFDGDSGFEARALADGKSAEKIAEERASHISSNRKLLKYFELDEVDFPPQQIGDAVAIFEDHLEAFLEAEWPEWTTSCAEVEDSAGVSLRKNQFAYRVATVAAGGSVPEMLEQVLNKVEEV